MKKLFLAVLILMFSGMANAASLHWDAVLDTETCTINGYIVYAIPSAGGIEKNLNVGKVLLLPNLTESLNLIPGKEYNFFVTAYADGGEGPRQTDPLVWLSPVATWTPPVDNIGPTIIIIPGPVQQVIVN